MEGPGTEGRLALTASAVPGRTNSPPQDIIQSPLLGLGVLAHRLPPAILPGGFFRPRGPCSAQLDRSGVVSGLGTRALAPVWGDSC